MRSSETMPTAGATESSPPTAKNTSSSVVIASP